MVIDQMLYELQAPLSKKKGIEVLQSTLKTVNWFVESNKIDVPKIILIGCNINREYLPKILGQNPKYFSSQSHQKITNNPGNLRVGQNMNEALPAGRIDLAVQNKVL